MRVSQKKVLFFTRHRKSQFFFDSPCRKYRKLEFPVEKKLKFLKKISEFFKAYVTPRLFMSVHKKCPVGIAVWPATGNIYMNVLFYYIEDEENVEKVENVENVEKVEKVENV